MTGLVTRFAPSPTGRLHLGHAFSAITVWEAARAAGGRALLRIEDIDAGRVRPEFEAAILEDLAWLGLDWDPPLWRQSERLPVYAEALAGLTRRGLVYRCFKSRSEIAEALNAPHGPVGPAYVGAPLPEAEEARRLAEGAPFAWRLSLKAARAALPSDLSWTEETVDGPASHAVDFALVGDVVLGRKDIGTSYHLASVVDDIASGVTHVIRGEDLREAAPVHAVLYALFGAPPPVYRHHRLVTDAEGKRLAKRDRAQTLQSLREAGETPASVRAMLGLPQQTA